MIAKPFRPMLACPDVVIADLHYPLYASYKYDGIRATVVAGKLLARSGDLIRNEDVQAKFGRKELEGMDGELIIGHPTAKDCYRKTASCVNSLAGGPYQLVKFFIFDLCNSPLPFLKRQDDLAVLTAGQLGVEHVKHLLIKSPLLLDRELKQALIFGYEGLITRSPDGLYKHGRSTPAEQGMVKLKAFVDSEARVIAVREKMHNTNDKELDARGYTKRSSKKAGMVGADTMGMLECQDLKTGVEFGLGTGFSDDERAWWWARRFRIVSAADSKRDEFIVKYKFQPAGVKDKPRFPSYLGLRDKRDL